MQRSAVSIASNIAEGSKRGGKKEFRQFVRTAYGSGAELETQLEIAKHLPFSTGLNFRIAESLLDEVMRMLKASPGQYQGVGPIQAGPGRGQTPSRQP